MIRKKTGLLAALLLSSAAQANGTLFNADVAHKSCRDTIMKNESESTTVRILDMSVQQGNKAHLAKCVAKTRISVQTGPGRFVTRNVQYTGILDHMTGAWDWNAHTLRD